MLADNGVRPRRVHDVEVAQESNGLVTLDQISVQRHVARRFAVAEDVDLVGRWQHVHPAKLLAEERVEQRAFAGFHLPDHHEQERLAQPRLEMAESLDGFGGGVGLDGEIGQGGERRGQFGAAF